MSTLSKAQMECLQRILGLDGSSLSLTGTYEVEKGRRASRYSLQLIADDEEPYRLENGAVGMQLSFVVDGEDNYRDVKVKDITDFLGQGKVDSWQRQRFSGYASSWRKIDPASIARAFMHPYEVHEIDLMKVEPNRPQGLRVVDLEVSPGDRIVIPARNALIRTNGVIGWPAGTLYTGSPSLGFSGMPISMDRVRDMTIVVEVPRTFDGEGFIEMMQGDGPVLQVNVRRRSVDASTAPSEPPPTPDRPCQAIEAYVRMSAERELQVIIKGREGKLMPGDGIVVLYGIEGREKPYTISFDVSEATEGGPVPIKEDTLSVREDPPVIGYLIVRLSRSGERIELNVDPRYDPLDSRPKPANVGPSVRSAM